ncbi:gamma-carboxymuconolactone decarboxylase [Paenibacillus swuensis]|uniref:Gamma-carboxymuconolactone decarboxylase n=1 Tax=Paenibacillus swuensis TaxID=1178515 RepID=A0A172TMZ6_9BACL|nr:carboxymuconolactone decarboxylase family protein [Paenibacillus swuensis]ANE48264.1 gamma-carboxymuconolactone decarboxylase [Paenibacillus swuensis]
MSDQMESKVRAYKDELTHMSAQMPQVVETYHQFTGECFQEGALDAKTKQLIALGMGLFANNEVCTFYHVREALQKGATPEEVMETVAVAGAVGGGHAISQGVTRVQKALEGIVH